MGGFFKLTYYYYKFYQNKFVSWLADSLNPKKTLPWNPSVAELEESAEKILLQQPETVNNTVLETLDKTINGREIATEYYAKLDKPCKGHEHFLSVMKSIYQKYKDYIESLLQEATESKKDETTEVPEKSDSENSDKIVVTSECAASQQRFKKGKKRSQKKRIKKKDGTSKLHEQTLAFLNKMDQEVQKMQIAPEVVQREKFLQDISLPELLDDPEYLDEAKFCAEVEHPDGSINIPKAMFLAMSAKTHDEHWKKYMDLPPMLEGGSDMVDSDEELYFVYAAYDLDRFMKVVDDAWQGYSKGEITLFQAVSLTNYAVRATCVLAADIFRRTEKNMFALADLIPWDKTEYLKYFALTHQALSMFAKDLLYPQAELLSGRTAEWRNVVKIMFGSTGIPQLASDCQAAIGSVLKPVSSLLIDFLLDASVSDAVRFASTFAVEALMRSVLHTKGPAVTQAKQEMASSLEILHNGLLYVQGSELLSTHYDLEDETEHYLLTLLELTKPQVVAQFKKNRIPWKDGNFLEGIATFQYITGWAVFDARNAILVFHYYRILVIRGKLERHPFFETMCKRFAPFLFPTRKGKKVTSENWDRERHSGTFFDDLMFTFGVNNDLRTVTILPRFRINCSRYHHFYMYGSRSNPEDVFGDIDEKDITDLATQFIKRISNSTEQEIIGTNFLLLATITEMVFSLLPTQMPEVSHLHDHPWQGYVAFSVIEALDGGTKTYRKYTQEDYDFPLSCYLPQVINAFTTIYEDKTIPFDAVTFWPAKKMGEEQSK
jgi:hypothetical protein